MLQNIKLIESKVWTKFKFFNSIDIYVSTSLRDGGLVSLREAMACEIDNCSNNSDNPYI